MLAKTQDEWDVIVVGLGCAGLSTAYWCAKQGLKVLGLERNHASGALGSSSYGETRIYRILHDLEIHTRMMRDTLPLWKEIEEDSQTQLLTPGALLLFGDPTHPYFKKVLS